MSKRETNFKIVSNRRITHEYFILGLKSSELLPVIKPGQFVQVRIDGNSQTFLRRPISVYDVDQSEGILSLLVKIVGSGTQTLSLLEAGDNLNLIYPLGNTFSDPVHDDVIMLVGGGVGVAPLYLLGRQLKDSGYKVTFILGYRSGSQIIEYEKFASVGRVLITTEDGTEGFTGLVTDHPVFSDEKPTKIYCCGPEPMMKAVARLAHEIGASCEVSLENLMACGFGVCLCCIVDTDKGNVCTCTDGPVFNIKNLKWQI